MDDNWRASCQLAPAHRFAEENGAQRHQNCPMFSPGTVAGRQESRTAPATGGACSPMVPSANFGLNFDPSHFALQFIEPTSALHEFKDKLFHFHAKDVRIHRERLNQVGVFAPPLEWHQPRVPGFGEIDWAHFMSVLLETGYDDPVCIEVEDEPLARSPVGALRVARNIPRAFIG